MRFLKISLLLVPFLSVAQDVQEKVPLTVYVSSGINFTKVNETRFFSAFSTDGNKNYVSEQGLQLGAGVLIAISKMTSLDIGAQYSHRNYSASNDDVFMATVKENLQFLSLPVRLKISPFQSKLAPFFQVGTEYSRLLKSDISANRSGGTNFFLEDSDVSDMRNRNTFSVNLGIGLEYFLARGSLFIVSSYYRGLTEMNIAEKRYSNPSLSGDLQYVDSDFKLDRFQFSVGYAFEL